MPVGTHIFRFKPTGSLSRDACDDIEIAFLTVFRGDDRITGRLRQALIERPVQVLGSVLLGTTEAKPSRVMSPRRRTNGHREPKTPHNKGESVSLMSTSEDTALTEHQRT